LRAAAASVTALLVAACSPAVLDGHGRASGAPPTVPGTGTGTTTGTTTGPTPPEPSQPPADFTDCKQFIKVGLLGIPAARLSRLSFECATISVPLDYAEPDGNKINIQLLRIHDSDNHDGIGSLLVNPGGPGGSGVELALGLVGQLSDTILSHFDIVGFDPRGVGLSSPVDCLSDSQQDAFNAASPNVLTAKGFEQAKSLAESYAAKCSAKYGSALAQYDTVQAAKDMDQVRQAVGDSRLNYLGFSYGTELGAQYLHLYPSTVRVAVLDGAVDPLYGPLKSAEKQLQGFEDGFDQFAAWCRQHAPCSSLGDPRQAVYRIVAAARRAPIPSSAPGETRRATVNLVLTGVSEAMYSQPEWDTLGKALIEAEGGDSKGLLALADRYFQRYGGHYTNLMDAFNTVSCNDSRPGPSDATIRATAQRWAAKYPMFGEQFAAGLFICQQWQPDRTVPPLPTAPTTPNTILVVGNLHDPATPYQGAKDLTRTLGNAELLTWDGEGHTSYLQGSNCVDDYVNAYLVDVTLPPPNTTCPR
jgi:pimeloyl-ACP methyl ester carboxylesterase